MLKIEGPYRHRGGWRCRLVRGSGSSRQVENCPTLPTPEAAYRAAEDCRAAHEQTADVTVAEAISKYQQKQRDEGNRETSIAATGHALTRFFNSVLQRPLASITPTRAAALYDALRQRLAVDTHRNYLSQAKSLCAWAVKQKLLQRNPLAEVEPLGRRRHGKKQLRFDEARRLMDLCQRLGPEDDGAVAVLLALLCALRAGEIVSRTVRDLDNGGTILWIEETEDGFETKTKAGRRRVEVPRELQPLLSARCKDKLPNALLFQSSKTGGGHWRDWVNKETGRLCKLAKVPVVCAHSLRGFHATAAVSAGMSPHLVAAALGHESPSMTLAAYAAPGSAQAAEQLRGIHALRERNAPEPGEPAKTLPGPVPKRSGGDH